MGSPNYRQHINSKRLTTRCQRAICQASYRRPARESAAGASGLADRRQIGRPLVTPNQRAPSRRPQADCQARASSAGPRRCRKFRQGFTIGSQPSRPGNAVTPRAPLPGNRALEPIFGWRSLAPPLEHHAPDMITFGDFTHWGPEAGLAARRSGSLNRQPVGGRLPRAPS